MSGEASRAVPLIARMLLDAYEAFERAADRVPEAARDVAPPHCNSPGWVVGHIADQQDRFWNADLQSLERDAWLEASEDAFRPLAAPQTPPFEEARDALERVLAQARLYIAGLDSADLAKRSEPRGEESRLHYLHGETIEQLLVRSVAHVFAHAGELDVIASLGGAQGGGLPGRLEHSRGLR